MGFANFNAERLQGYRLFSVPAGTRWPAIRTSATLRALIACEAVRATTGREILIVPLAGAGGGRAGVRFRPVLEQEWRRSLHEARQRRGDLDGWYILLNLELLQQRLEGLGLSALQGGRDALLELCDALIVHVFDRRQLHGFDRLAGVAFDDAQHVALTGCHEQDGVTLAARATGTPDTVDVGLRVVRDVVIDDVRDALDINAARCHIGSDDNIQLPVLQPGNRAFALRLRNITVQFGGVEAASAQFLGKFGGLKLGAHEHQHGVEAFGLQHPGQSVKLVQAADQPVALADLRRGAGLLPDDDLGRTAHMFLRDPPHGVGHSCREQGDLAPPLGSD